MGKLAEIITSLEFGIENLMENTLGSTVDYLGKRVGKCAERCQEKKGKKIKRSPEKVIREAIAIDQIAGGVRIMKNSKNCNYRIFWENALNKFRRGDEECKNPEVIGAMLDDRFVRNLAYDKKFFKDAGINYSKVEFDLIRAGAAYASYKQVA